MPKYLTPAGACMSSVDFDLSSRPLLWVSVKQVWHLAMTEDWYFIANLQKGHVTNELYTFICGKKAKSNIKDNFDTFPEGATLCPTCYAFYRGLTYTGPDHRKKGWRKPVTKKEVPWYDK